MDELVVRYDERNCLDEIVAKAAYVHLERMDEHWFCLIVDDGKKRLLVNVGTPQKYRRRVNATIYADEVSDTCMGCLRSTKGCVCSSDSADEQQK